AAGAGGRVADGAVLGRGVTAEDAVCIGPGAILSNDRFPRAAAATRLLDGLPDPEPSPVVVRHGSSIGAGAVIVAPAEIGAFATVGGGAVVTRDVPGHGLVAGSPAHRIGRACACGHR